MNLTISGHHIEVTPSLKSYVTDKLAKVTAHFDNLISAKVTLSVEKQKENDGQRAECTLHMKGADLFAESTHADLYIAIDEMIAKLDRQVLRQKEKTQDQTKEGGKHAPVP